MKKAANNNATNETKFWASVKKNGNHIKIRRANLSSVMLCTNQNGSWVAHNKIASSVLGQASQKTNCAFLYLGKAIELSEHALNALKHEVGVKISGLAKNVSYDYWLEHEYIQQAIKKNAEKTAGKTIQIITYDDVCIGILGGSSKFIEAGANSKQCSNMLGNSVEVFER